MSGNVSTTGAATLILLLLAPPAPCQHPSSAPADVSNGWEAGWFDYEKPQHLPVEENMPTPDQISFQKFLPQMRAGETPLATPSASARPLSAAGMNIVHLKFRDVEGEIVPALLCTPQDQSGPFPLVVAVHGLGNHKARMARMLGPPLAKLGFAVLALDLPFHGERPGSPLMIFNRSDPRESFRIYRQGVTDVRQCIDVAEQRPDIDCDRGVFLLGYSMGSWLVSVVGPSDPRVRGMVLMAGGANEVPTSALLPQHVACLDPRRALSHFHGPVLMLNGRRDILVTPRAGQKLFDGASEPKKQLWYDSGHHLPLEAYDDVADWVAEKWAQTSSE